MSVRAWALAYMVLQYVCVVGCFPVVRACVYFIEYIETYVAVTYRNARSIHDVSFKAV